MSHQTFLFEFGCGKAEDFQTEVLLAHLIFFMLVQEAHCYLISSGGKNGEMLAVQDGFIYFYGDDDRLVEAKKLLDDLVADPTKPAFWVYPE